MNPIHQYDPADEPLWLIIEREAQTRCFEFPSNSHKAIVVGSSETADVRIRNVAPVAFFLERDDHWIWLIPACPRAELRLDMTKIEGKRRICTQGLVELGDVELRLKVRDTPPTLRSDSDWAVTTAIDTSTVSASLQQNTTVSVPLGFSRYTMGLPVETLGLVPSNFDEWFDDAIAPTPHGVVDSPHFEPAQTPLTPKDSAEATAAESEAVPLHTSQFAPGTKTLEMALFVRPERIVPNRTIEIAANRSSEFEPTKHRSRPSLGALRKTMTIQLGHICQGGNTIDPAEPITKPSGQPPTQGTDGKQLSTAESCNTASTRGDAAASPTSTRRFLSPTAALQRLGLLAMRRPWAVLTGAAAGSLLLMMLVFVTARLMRHEHSPYKPDSGRFHDH